MPRLFTAIDLPGRVKEDIANICYGIPNVKWVELAQIHLTLHFIGEVSDAVAHDVLDALHEVRSPRFTIRVRGTGHFPPRRDPRVLWVGVERSEPLAVLHGRIGAALEAAGVEVEKRKFSPHITVARVKEHTPLERLASFFVDNSLFETDPVEVGEFHLYSSQLRESGALHAREATYPIG